jgi:hypothetical protein
MVVSMNEKKNRKCGSPCEENMSCLQIGEPVLGIGNPKC